MKSLVLRYLKNTGYFQRAFNFFRPLVSRTLINLHYGAYDEFLEYVERENIFRVYGRRIEVVVEVNNFEKIIVADRFSSEATFIIKSEHGFLDMPFVVKILSEFFKKRFRKEVVFYFKEPYYVLAGIYFGAFVSGYIADSFRINPVFFAPYTVNRANGFVIGNIELYNLLPPPKFLVKNIEEARSGFAPL